jgi:predicted metal-binding protein
MKFNLLKYLGKHLPDKIKLCPICNQNIEANMYNTHVDSHPSKILDWLYIGTYNNATNKKELDNLDIKCILNCARECNNLFQKELEYLHLKLAVNFFVIFLGSN